MSKHFCWNEASPTASTSSIIRISACAWMAREKASRTSIPDEKFLSLWSTNCSSSAKPMISSQRRCSSAHPRDAPPQQDGLRWGRLGVDAAAQLEEGRPFALDPPPPRVGPVDPQQDL